MVYLSALKSLPDTVPELQEVELLDVLISRQKLSIPNLKCFFILVRQPP